MGYSGLIYAAIVAAWAAFLVPRWVRRNEEVERAREADTARGVRVLERRAGPIHAAHNSFVGRDGERTVLHGGASGLVVGAAEVPEDARAAADVSRPRPKMAPPPDLDTRFAAAARRRRRILLALFLTTLVVAVGAYTGPVPGWAPPMSVALTAVFLLLARRAAVAEARRRQALRRRALRRHVTEAAARADHVEGADEDAGRRLVIPEQVPEEADPDAWQPVPVPLPTYMTKPKAPRVVRKIDLSQPGSWTSGRLDPVGSVELPRRDPVERQSVASAEAADERPVQEEHQHRRAVGD